ncbi:MAG: DUF1295 domain-containing protein [Erysipelotrichales bacterium]|nr:DUF1295 domain-containing protein [Erysipelotrichales bacterium]
MKKIQGLLILLLSYIVAFALGFLVTYLLISKLSLNLLLSIFIGNVVATIIIWFVGILFHTASTYDPYWSLQTLFISLVLLIYTNNWKNPGNILFLVFLSFWAIRLTYNFIRSFNDITYIDWRYRMLKEKTGKFFQLVNLLGICMVPTIIVYLASVPMFLYIIQNRQFEPLNIIGLGIMLLGTILELVADNNMAKFKKIRKDNSEIINVGLWKYSRHPNYLGEILFWYGVAFVFIISPSFALRDWYAIVGTILNTLLFIFISIPMAENHMKNYKSGFAEYKKKTRMLLPIKK